MNSKNNYGLFDLDEMEIENDCLSPKECMNYLFIGKSTFYKLVNSGELPAFQRKALESSKVWTTDIYTQKYVVGGWADGQIKTIL